MNDLAPEKRMKVVFQFALIELGLTEQFLIQLAEDLSDRRYMLENFYQEMGMGLFKKLCEVLCLEMKMFSEGYDKSIHHLNIIKSIQNNSFVLPRTENVEKIIKLLHL